MQSVSQITGSFVWASAVWCPVVPTGEKNNAAWVRTIWFSVIISLSVARVSNFRKNDGNWKRYFRKNVSKRINRFITKVFETISVLRGGVIDLENLKVSDTRLSRLVTMRMLLYTRFVDGLCAHELKYPSQYYSRCLSTLTLMDVLFDRTWRSRPVRPIK